MSALVQLQQLTQQTFKNAGLDPAFGCAIIEHESGWNPNARSPKTASDEKYGGAWGLCQILLTVAQGFGYVGDGPGLWDPSTNLYYFCQLTLRNVSKLGGFPEIAIKDLVSMHNSGKIFDHAPMSTTATYVPAVMKLYAKWQKLLAVDGAQVS